MTTCTPCGSQWGGLKTCHCTGCHQTFTVQSAADKHRIGSHAYDTRTCTTPAAAGLVDAGRGYSCWGFPGRDDDDDDLLTTETAEGHTEAKTTKGSEE